MELRNSCQKLIILKILMIHLSFTKLIRQTKKEINFDLKVIYKTERDRLAKRVDVVHYYFFVKFFHIPGVFLS